MNRSANTTSATHAEAWFVAKDAGAVEYCLHDLREEIASGAVNEHHLVWRHGMSEWIELEQVPLLRMLVATRREQPNQPVPAAGCAVDSIASKGASSESEAKQSTDNDSRSRLESGCGSDGIRCASGPMQ